MIELHKIEVLYMQMFLSFKNIPFAHVQSPVDCTEVQQKNFANFVS